MFTIVLKKKKKQQNTLAMKCVLYKFDGAK